MYGMVRARAVELFGRLRKDNKGVTALEYGLIAALIAVVIIGSVTALGGQLNTTFQQVADAIGRAVGGGTPTGP